MKTLMTNINNRSKKIEANLTFQRSRWESCWACCFLLILNIFFKRRSLFTILNVLVNRAFLNEKIVFWQVVTFFYQVFWIDLRDFSKWESFSNTWAKLLKKFKLWTKTILSLKLWINNVELMNLKWDVVCKINDWHVLLMLFVIQQNNYTTHYIYVLFKSYTFFKIITIMSIMKNFNFWTTYLN